MSGYEAMLGITVTLLIGHRAKKYLLAAPSLGSSLGGRRRKGDTATSTKAYAKGKAPCGLYVYVRTLYRNTLRFAIDCRSTVDVIIWSDRRVERGCFLAARDARAYFRIGFGIPRKYQYANTRLIVDIC
eukprot:6204986-Pleurochrysis_carterae.AAC.2